MIGVSLSSLPTIVAYTVFMASCIVMAIVQHPQCADPGQLQHTRNQATMLQGWVLSMLATAFTSIIMSGAVLSRKRTVSSPQGASAAQDDVLKRNASVLSFVGWCHLRTGCLVMLPSVVLTFFMSVFPDRVCLTSEMRLLFVGSVFTACKCTVSVQSAQLKFHARGTSGFTYNPRPS